jgi:hypothetical protein
LITLFAPGNEQFSGIITVGLRFTKYKERQKIKTIALENTRYEKKMSWHKGLPCARFKHKVLR